jgi:hypothetical protein
MGQPLTDIALRGASQIVADKTHPKARDEPPCQLISQLHFAWDKNAPEDSNLHEKVDEAASSWLLATAQD